MYIQYCDCIPVLCKHRVCTVSLEFLELVESAMYIYQATGDPQMLHIGASIIDAINSIARTECGYAVIHDVNTHTLANRMESFFLAETTKYLYLLFDKENFIHNPGTEGTIVNTPKGQCVIDGGGYVFNTEAHPIDMAALDCCHNPSREQFKNVMNDIDPTHIVDPSAGLSRFFSDKEKDADGYEELHVELGETVDEQVELPPTKIEIIKKRQQLFTCPVEPFKWRFGLYGETIPE